MKASFFAILASLTSLETAEAQSTHSIAQGLANLLASEEPCGLSYNQDVLADWIEANVPADDMNFSSYLSTYMFGAESKFSTMSGSTKTAHCTAIRRTAANYGFID